MIKIWETENSYLLRRIMKILQRVIIFAFLLLMACGPENSAQPEELQLKSISIEPTNDPDKNNTYEILVHFNRPFTPEELKPAPGYRHTYGIKYWLESKTGWSCKPWDVRIVQGGLTRNDNSSYLLTSESSHHPLRGWNPKTDEAFTPTNISSVIVELYIQDKRDDE